MADESPKGTIANVADAVKGVVEAVPIYQDAAQPAAQEFGKTIEPAGKELGEAIVVVAKAVNVALFPLRGLVWGYEQIADYIQDKVSKKLEDVPADDVQSPKPNVAVPAIEALRYAGHEPELSELYANLLVSSMDAKTAALAHPAFVEIIKQLTPDEAKILKRITKTVPFRGSVVLLASPLLSLQGNLDVGGGFIFEHNFSIIGEEANCEHPHLTPQYVDNLCRLGLCEIPKLNPGYMDQSLYEPLKNHPFILKRIEEIQSTNLSPLSITFQMERIELTRLGKQFFNSCMGDHSTLRKSADG